MRRICFRANSTPILNLSARVIMLTLSPVFSLKAKKIKALEGLFYRQIFHYFDRIYAFALFLSHDALPVLGFIPQE